MSRFIAFLRGMNVGGHRITNVALCQCFADIGFTNVEAFLASGNVVFDADSSASKTKSLLEQGLKASLGYDVPTFIRSAKQVTQIAQAAPFADRDAIERGKLQVALLTKKPSASAMRAVLELATSDDWLTFNAQELYWWPIGNMSDSALDHAAIARALGPPTVRTHRTLTRLHAKFLS